jgi:hypothetical protein
MTQYYVCAECGREYFYDPYSLTTHHVGDDGGPDHDEDADHVAYAEEEPDVDYDEEYEFNKQVLNDVMTKNPDLSFSSEEVRDILRGD